MAQAGVPGSIAEEYYQISEAILSSFSKYRPPVDLFRLNEELVQLAPYSRKGNRLSNEQVEEVRRLCEEGNLFVSRTDHPIYSQHIVKQLDLILVDRNLKEGEIADITVRALGMRLADFFEQPVKAAFEPLFTDIMVFTEYLWEDKHRIKNFMRRLQPGEYSLIKHSMNCFILGVWMLLTARGDELTRKELDRASQALLLHDVGMTKIPGFITGKTTPLKPDEKEKIPPHPIVGAKIMQKLDLFFDEAREAVLQHHERLDGSGYPQKLKGNDISRLGRIAAVADSFSSMIQDRPYEAAKDMLTAARELSQDNARYDKLFTGMLLSALVTNAFGPMQALPQEPKS